MHSTNTPRTRRRLTPYLITVGLGISAAAHAGEPKSKAEPASEIPPPTIDTNGDRTPDAWDRDGNGRADAWDIDGDDRPDVVDDNGDGKPDLAR